MSAQLERDRTEPRDPREKRPPAVERWRLETMALSKRLKAARDASRAGETR
jgi:hypothetical protein